MSISTRRELIRRYKPEYDKAKIVRRRVGFSTPVPGNGVESKVRSGSASQAVATGRKVTRRRKRTYGPNEEAALVKLWSLG